LQDLFSLKHATGSVIESIKYQNIDIVLSYFRFIIEVEASSATLSRLIHMDSILPLIKFSRTAHTFDSSTERTLRRTNPEARAPYRADHDDAMIQTENLCQKRWEKSLIEAWRWSRSKASHATTAYNRAANLTRGADRTVC
jgi:hypothetical protein